MTLGDDIRQAREQAQLTQPQLAELVGVSEGTISNWERSVVKAPKNRLARVWQVLEAYRDPQPATRNGFDPSELVASLDDEQLAKLAAVLPDTVIAEDVARRLRRHTSGQVPSVPDRMWRNADVPSRSTELGKPRRRGAQPG